MKKLMTGFICTLCSTVALAQMPAAQEPLQAQQETTTALETSHAHEVKADTVTGTDLNITGAYVQPLIPGQKNTAAYMTINNPTDETFVLTGAYSSLAGKVSLHTSIMENGMVKMRDAGALTLLPQQKLILQPGDLHLMLMDVNTQLSKDMNVPICLEFKDSDVVCLQVPVADKRVQGDKHVH